MATERSGANAGLVALRLVLEDERYRAMPAEDLLGRYLSERDERAFAALVRRYGRLVMARCREILRREDLAQEAFQETFTQLVVNGHRVRRRGAVGRWLARTARRRSLNVARRERRQQARDLAYAPVPTTADPGATANEADVRATISRAMSTLPERYRLPIELVYFDGMTHAEAANAIGCSKGTLDSYVRRALARLNRVLTPSGLLVGGAAVLTPPLEAVPVDWVQRVIVCATSISARKPSPLALLWYRLASPPATAVAAVVGIVCAGIIVSLVQNKKSPDPPVPNPPTLASDVPPQAPDKSPDDVVHGQVVSILDKLTGMKTERTMAIQEGPRHVRWRFKWRRDPDKQVRYGSLLAKDAFVDLVFDRWSGKVDMELAADGKTANNINPTLPITVGPFHIRMPELIELHRAFPRMLMSGVPPRERIGPLHPELVYGVVDPTVDNLGMARPEPDQGVMIRVNPGETMVATRELLAGGNQTFILFWRNGQSAHVHEIERGHAPWTYRNDSTKPQEWFIAGICMKQGRWRSTQARMKKPTDDTRIIDFDEDYEGAYDDARLVIAVK